MLADDQFAYNCWTLFWWLINDNQSWLRSHDKGWQQQQQVVQHKQNNIVAGHQLMKLTNKIAYEKIDKKYMWSKAIAKSNSSITLHHQIKCQMICWQTEEDETNLALCGHPIRNRACTTVCVHWTVRVCYWYSVLHSCWRAVHHAEEEDADDHESSEWSSSSSSSSADELCTCTAVQLCHN